MGHNIRKCDKLLLILTLLFTLLGLVMIYSASSIVAVMRYNQSTNYYFFRQLFFSIVGLFIGFLIVINVPIKKYRFLMIPLFIILSCLLFFLLIQGDVKNGAKSWLGIGSFGIQPTEFVKAYVIILFGYFYGEKMRRTKNKWAIFIPIIVSIFFFILIAMQPDLGGALILLLVVAMMFYAIPFPRNKMIKNLKIIGVVGLACVFCVLAFSDKFLTEAQAKRFKFKDPCSRYVEDTGYQVCNSLISVSNGGFFGLGLGNSTQKYLYLPEAHTDFIFAIVLEELGALGGIVILIGYLLMLYRILKIAKTSEFLSGSIIAYGTFALIFFHIIINLMGILGMIPLTGVPLPFLSYGGSFNLVLLVLLFAVQRVKVESYNIKRKREIQQIR